MAQAYPIRRMFSPEEYLTLERRAQTRSEYWRGEIYAMAGGSPTHSLIAANIGGLLFMQLRGSSCRVYNSDLKVRSTPEGLFAYPDVTVGCGEPVFHDAQADVLTNPQVIVEVLSPSTADFDRTTKRLQYQEIASVTDILLVYQEEARIEHYARQSENQWLYTIIVGLNAQATLALLQVTLALSEVYANVTFPAS